MFKIQEEGRQTSSSIVSQGQLPTSFLILLPRHIENPSSPEVEFECDRPAIGRWVDDDVGDHPGLGTCYYDGMVRRCIN
jgi:hypothetical protein